MCSAQIPGYIDNYEVFKAKGVTGIYIVAVNDQFVMKWVHCLIFAPGLMLV